MNSTASIGGANFSGNVYLACNRDNGNGETLNVQGTITTSSTANPAVILEGFHTHLNGTDTGQTQANNMTVGNGGTIQVSTVPASQSTGEGSILAFNSNSLLNAGATGTVKFIATSVAGDTTDGFLSVVGTPNLPMSVTAGTVLVTAAVSSTGPAASVYVSDTVAAKYTATIAGGLDVNGLTSSMELSTTSGVLTIAGTTSNSTGGSIKLTGAGGVAINAQLGSASTGNIAINAGANQAILNTTFAPTSTEMVGVTAAGGLTVSPTGVLAGSTAAGTVGSNPVSIMPVTVQSGGLISPGGVGTAGTLNIGDLSISTGGTLRLDLNSNTVFDSLNVTGAANISGATLQLFVNGPLTTGTSYTLISNDGADAVLGQFTAGTTIVAANNLRYVFALNYAGGDGNDIVATVTVNPNSVLDVTNSVVAYQSIDSVANNVTVTQSGGNYTLTDSATLISLTANAMAAGWTGDGTNTVTGPVAGVTGLTLGLSDGADTVAGISAGSASVGINGTGTVAVSGVVSSTSTISIGGVTDLSVSSTGSLQGATLNLTASNSLGTVTNPVLTQAATIVASAGAGGMYITEADGAYVTATATGAGNISIVNTAGTLNIAGATSTVSGNISLSSGDAITLSANLNAGSGTIAIAANTDGAGTDGYDQKAAALTTTNTGANAIAITVNTAAGGTGSATIGQGSTGAGGTVTVAANGGSVLWSNDPSYTAFGNSQLGLTNGGSNTQTLKTQNYIVTATGAGSIGTTARPIQSGTLSGATVSLSAGSGGIFWVDWTSVWTLSQALAAGGDVRVVSANAGGHVLNIAGNVNTANGGNIYLASDDDLIVKPGVTIGGNTFNGTVYMSANRDRGTAGTPFTIDATSSIITSSTVNNAVPVTQLRATTDQAVYLDISGDPGTPSIITLGNITTGDGGRIVVNAIPYANLATGAETDAGKIVMASTTNVLNAGPTGTVELVGRISASTAADAIGTAAAPISVTAANIVTNSNYGNVYVTNSVAGTVASSTLAVNTDGATGQTGAVSLNFATTSGALTVSVPLANITGGAINLIGAGGVILNASVGSSTTGAIAITGGVSGAASIVSGAGDVTISQSANSTYDGIISGPKGLVKSGNGSLTLSAAQTYTGATTINAGILAPDNTLATSGVTVASGGALAGTGTVPNVAVAGQIAPATFGTTGILNTGNLSFPGGGTLVADLTSAAAGPGSGYDQLNVAGTVDLTNANLKLIVPPTGINVGDSFTLIANNGTNAVTSQFTGGTTIQSFNNPLYFFTLNYTGGAGNDVVATLSLIATSGILDVTNGLANYSAGAGVNNILSVDNNGLDFVISDTANAIILTANAVAAGWTVTGGVATGPVAGLSSFVFNLNDGADGFTLLNAGGASVMVNGTGSLAINGAVTTTNTFTASQFVSVSGTGAISAAIVTFTGASNTPLAFGAMTVASGSVSISDNSTVTFNDVFSAPTSPFTLTGATSIAAGTGGQIAAAMLTLGASNGIGTSAQPLGTQTATITANGGTGGVYITEADGADITVTATGAGNVAIVSTTGTLNVAGPTSTVNGSLSLTGGSVSIGAATTTINGNMVLTGATGVSVNAALSTNSGNITVNNGSGALATLATLTTTSGNVSLSSGDNITLGANVNAGSGTIAIAANTDGAGSQGFDQTSAILTTTNTGANALTITVNTAAGGAGNAVIGQASIGSTSGGTITVNSNGGNILWSNDPIYGTFSNSQLGLGNGGSSTQTLRGRLYNFTASGAGGIGMDARPLQIDNFGPDSAAAVPPTLSASAGSGGIYVTGWDTNGTNDLTTGTLTATGAGGIRVAVANQTGHNLWVRGNVTTGSGGIYLAADDNMDIGPGIVIGGPGFSGPVWLSANRDLSTVGQPIQFDSTASIMSSCTINQNIVLSSRTPTTQAVYMDIGGGTASGTGIVQIANITVGNGGRVVLNGSNLVSPGQSGTIKMAAASNIINVGATGTLELDAILSSTAAADNIGSSSLPIKVAGGNVVVNSQFGNVWVTSTGAANFTANLTTIAGQGGLPSLNLATTSGLLTINGATANIKGGPISLSGGGGIVINAPLGGPATGNITLNAGASNTALLNSTLTLNDNEALTVTANNGLTVGATGVLGGIGATTNLFAINTLAGGTVNPGEPAGILTSGGANLAESNVVLEFDGPSTGSYGQINVTGSVTLTGATLKATLGGGYVPQLGDALTIIANDGTDTVAGQFTELPGRQFLHNIGGQYFQISYVGGTGNDVVLTCKNPPTFFVDDDWTGLTNGQAITDIDPMTSGNQAGTFGINAFTSINTAFAALPIYGIATVNSGTYNEAVVLNKSNLLNFQQGASSVGSLADTVNTSGVVLNGITLSVGGNNASTALASPISGTGGLNKVGAGTLTLGAASTYSGPTGVSGGTLVVASGGSLPTASVVSSSGTLIVNGTVHDVQVGASLAAAPVASGSVLRGTGTAGNVTFNDPTNVNASIWPGLAFGTPSLTTNESTTPLTVTSIDFSNGGKFAVAVKDDNGSPKWQQLLVKIACAIPPTNAAFSSLQRMRPHLASKAPPRPTWSSAIQSRQSARHSQPSSHPPARFWARTSISSTPIPETRQTSRSNPCWAAGRV